MLQRDKKKVQKGVGTDETADFIYEFLNWHSGKTLKQK
jgi:hypothetical protein